MTMALDSIALQELERGMTPTQFEIEAAMIPNPKEWRVLAQTRAKVNPLAALDYLTTLYDQKEAVENSGKKTNAMKAHDFVFNHFFVGHDRPEKVQQNHIADMLADLSELMEVGVANIGFSRSVFRKNKVFVGLGVLLLHVREAQAKIDLSCTALVQDLKKKDHGVLDKRDNRLFLLATLHQPIAEALFFATREPRVILRKRGSVSARTLTMG